MMPTSFQLNVVPVATPLVNVPKAVLLTSVGLSVSPKPGTSAEVSFTLSGLASLPKLGVVVPPVVVAVTVTLNASPALTNFPPVAFTAAGFTKFGDAVC